MKILVTGSSGTIGTRLCERLFESEHEVVGADWEPCKWSKEVESIRIDADLRDISAVKKLPKDIDMVIHLAANARVYELVEDPQRALDNVLSTFTMLEYARINDVKKFIFASSRETYGNTSADKYTEDMVRIHTCESPYTASKMSGEAFVHSYGQCYGMNPIIFRFSNVYGMYDDTIRVVPLFIRQARANEPLTVFGAEKCLDFTYIDDCIDGLMLSIEKYDQVAGETFNLAVGEGSTISALAELIIKLTGSESQIEMGNVRTGEIVKYVADVSHAKEKLGFEPKIPFEEGVKLAVEWYKENT